MKPAIVALTLIAAPACAFCPNPPAVLAPGPTEVYGCPLYSKTYNNEFWFSDYVIPYDNKLYGFIGNNDLATRIANIVAQNTVLLSMSTTFQVDMPLIPITFTPTGATFQSSGIPDFPDPVHIINRDVRQGQ